MNTASATYLSTTYPISEIHHPSATPCTTTQIPYSRLHGINILTPTPSLPYSPSSFSVISCLPLVSELPGSSIPIMLKECHRVLEPAGKM